MKELKSSYSEQGLAIELCDFLSNKESAIQSGNLNLFGLIDATGNNTAAPNFFREAWDAEFFPLFLKTDKESCFPRSPILVIPEARHTAYLKHSGCIADGNITWFISGISLQQQIPFWQSLIYATSPLGERVLHRFWDGFVINSYLDVLTESALGQLFAPAHALFVPAGDHWISKTLSHNQAPPAINQDAWWQIQPHHLRGFRHQFDQIQESDIQDRLWRQYPTQMGHVYPALIPRIIQSGTQRAKELGIRKESNIVRFIYLQLREFPGFWQQPLWQPVWHMKNTDVEFERKLIGVQKISGGEIK